MTYFFIGPGLVVKLRRGNLGVAPPLAAFLLIVPLELLFFSNPFIFIKVHNLYVQIVNIIFDWLRWRDGGILLLSSLLLSQSPLLSPSSDSPSLLSASFNSFS